MATIAIVGMLVAAARWGRVLALVVAAAGGHRGGGSRRPGVDRRPGPLGSAIYGLAGNATLGVIRTLPAAGGPTPRVVAFTLSLAAIPTLVAAAISPMGSKAVSGP
jgi:hypothetical protein